MRSLLAALADMAEGTNGALQVTRNGQALLAKSIDAGSERLETRVGELSPRETRLELAVSQRLTLFRENRCCRLSPPEIGCSLPEVYRAVAVG